jgi:hypothetical protein
MIFARRTIIFGSWVFQVGDDRNSSLTARRYAMAIRSWFERYPLSPCLGSLNETVDTFQNTLLIRDCTHHRVGIAIVQRFAFLPQRSRRSAEDRRRLADAARSMRKHTKLFSIFSLQFSAIICVLCGKNAVDFTF